MHLFTKPETLDLASSVPELKMVQVDWTMKQRIEEKDNLHLQKQQERLDKGLTNMNSEKVKGVVGNDAPLKHCSNTTKS